MDRPHREAPGYTSRIAPGLIDRARAIADRDRIDLGNALPVEIESIADEVAGRDNRAFEEVRLALLAIGRQSALADIQLGGGKPQLDVLALDTVAPARVRWLSEGRVPLGQVTVLVGDGGLGKSTWAANLAAQITQGEESGDLHGAPQAVLWLTAEDATSEVLVPRLIAAGADLSLVKEVRLRSSDGSIDLLTLPDNLQLFREAIRECRPALVIIDPLVAFLDDAIDSFVDKSVRRALGPLQAIAEELDLAILAVMHLNKRQARNLSARIGGSVGFRNGARSVLLWARHPRTPEDGTDRVLIHEKCNLAPLAVTLHYQLDGARIGEDQVDGEPIWTARVSLVGEAPGVTAATALAESNQDARTAQEEAEEFLLRSLDSGPVPARELRSEASELGISKRTLDRAKRTVGVKSVRRGEPKPGSNQPTWLWYRPGSKSANRAKRAGLGLSGDEGSSVVREVDFGGKSASGDQEEDVGNLGALGAGSGSDLDVAVENLLDGFPGAEVLSAEEYGGLAEPRSAARSNASGSRPTPVEDSPSRDARQTVGEQLVWNQLLADPPGFIESSMCRCGRDLTRPTVGGAPYCQACGPPSTAGHERRPP